MRNKFVSLKVLALLVIFCLTGSLTRAAVNPKPFVVPELKQWTGKDGNFTPGKDARIVCTSQNPELLRIARMFADDYQQMFGQTLSVAQGKATPGDFVLSLSADKKLGEEGYAIKITDRVAISAPTPTGLYRSIRTLLQLAEQNQERSLPQGTIRDYPDRNDFHEVGCRLFLEIDEFFLGVRAVTGCQSRERRGRKIPCFHRPLHPFCGSFGKQAVVWGALSHAKGDTPVKSENVVMNAWYNGYADPATMIKDGYQLISIPDGLVYIVPKAGYYYDYLNEPYLYKEWTPAHIGKAVFDEKHPSILGGMFAIWNDHVGNGISVKDNPSPHILAPANTLCKDVDRRSNRHSL